MRRLAPRLRGAGRGLRARRLVGSGCFARGHARRALKRRRHGERRVKAQGGQLGERHEIAAGGTDRARVVVADREGLGAGTVSRLSHIDPMPALVGHRFVVVPGRGGIVVAAMPMRGMAVAGMVVRRLLLRGRMRRLVAEKHRRGGDPLQGERGHDEPSDDEADDRHCYPIVAHCEKRPTDQPEMPTEHCLTCIRAFEAVEPATASILNLAPVATSSPERGEAEAQPPLARRSNFASATSAVTLS